MVKNKYILGEETYPIEYELFFEPDLEKFSFKGKARISVNALKLTKEIILNAVELKINSFFVMQDKESFRTKIKMDKKMERIILSLDKEIKGNFLVELEFEGVLNDSLAGFYRSKYYVGNEERYLATTQFEAPYARKAFPCFDQPDKKASFSISLKIPKNLQAISNMPIASGIIEGDKKIVKFEKSPLMSSYLVYMGVGEFEFIEANHEKIKVRIVTTPGKIKQGELALELTKKFLKYFEDYSGIKYPLPKLDMIALPDFAAGAMENWGAITFREIALLYDSEKSSIRAKKRVAEVIAHELWHQWSGNLVTMKWWNDLWLNESFATYMAYKAVDYYFPEWKMWEDFLVEFTGWAFSSDSLKSTHPIAASVKSANQIEEIFDGISYGKGGSVLRMIEHYLGEESFQKGVSNYLKKYQYNNAVASCLWDSLSEIGGEKIKEIIEDWIQKPGYPFINVKEDSKIVLSQQKFHGKGSIWKIPLTFQNKEEVTKQVFDSKKIELQVSGKIIFNRNQQGFYRVNYPGLNYLTQLLSHNTLTSLERWGLQNDLFNLSFYGYEDIRKYFDFARFYSNEESPFVLGDIYANLYKLFFLFSGEKWWEEIWPRFREHLKEPFKKSFDRLGWVPRKREPQDDSILRAVALNYLVFSEDKEVVREGLKKFEELLKDTAAVSADLKGAIYSVAAQQGKYDALISLYETTTSVEDKVKLLASLFKFKDEELLKKTLELSLSDKVRIQDLRTVFSVVASNPAFRGIFLSWVKKNWHRLKELKKTHFVFMGLLEAMITLYIGKEKEKELKEFFRKNEVGYKKTLANSFEVMGINTKFFEKNKERVKHYFS